MDDFLQRLEFHISILNDELSACRRLPTPNRGDLLTDLEYHPVSKSYSRKGPSPLFLALNKALKPFF